MEANITLDNAAATDVSTTGQAGLATVPVDAIKEFNLITNDFNAEYGRNASAQVQIVTKSGANDYHGRAALENGDLVTQSAISACCAARV